MAIELDDKLVAEIQRLGLMHNFTPAEVRALMQRAQLRRMETHQVLFGRGTLADEVAWVVQGRARAILPGAIRETPVMEFGPGCLVGFIGFIAQDRHLLEIFAVTELDVLVLGRAQFIQARRQQDPLFARLLMAMSFGAFDRIEIIQRVARNFIVTN